MIVGIVESEKITTPAKGTVIRIRFCFEGLPLGYEGIVKDEGFSMQKQLGLLFKEFGEQLLKRNDSALKSNRGEN